MSDWHVPERVLVDYVDQPATVDGVRAASIEQHLAACSRCQREVARLTPPADLDHVWHGVADRVDQIGVGFTGDFSAGWAYRLARRGCWQRRRRYVSAQWLRSSRR